MGERKEFFVKWVRILLEKILLLLIIVIEYLGEVLALIEELICDVIGAGIRLLSILTRIRPGIRVKVRVDIRLDILIFEIRLWQLVWFCGRVGRFFESKVAGAVWLDVVWGNWRWLLLLKWLRVLLSGKIIHVETIIMVAWSGGILLGLSLVGLFDDSVQWFSWVEEFAGVGLRSLMLAVGIVCEVVGVGGVIEAVLLEVVITWLVIERGETDIGFERVFFTHK